MLVIRATRRTIRPVKRLPFIAVLSGLVCAAGLWAFTRIADAPRLEDCVTVETFKGREECLSTALGEVAKADGPRAASVRLDEFLLTHPTMRDTCHQPAHVVGKVSKMPTREEMESYLASPQLRSCDWGVLHGVLFRYTQDRPLSDLESLLEVCAELGDQAGRSGCADSMGHVFWEASRDFTTASRACRSSAGVLNDCVSGVFMQLYSPVAPSGTGEQIGAALSLAEVKDLCAVDERDLATACARAAHYAYSQILGPVRYQMSRAADPGTVFQTDFLPALGDGLRFCAEFAAPGATECSQELSRLSLQLLLGFRVPEMLDAVCSAVPTGAAAYCAEAQKNMSAASTSG